MEVHTNVISFPLCELPDGTRKKIVDSLNQTKVFTMRKEELHEGREGTLPVRDQEVYMDWLGFLTYTNIPVELHSEIHSSMDKMSKLLELWDHECSLTVGNLFDVLKCIERYDVIYDVNKDLTEHLKYHENKTQVITTAHTPTAVISPTYRSQPTAASEKCITLYDTHDYIQHYHAFILFAPEDKEFATELIKFLISRNCVVCTVDMIQPGQIQHKAVVELIRERCKRVIVVYSPAFLATPKYAFYRDCVLDHDISQMSELPENSKIKMLPIMYKRCVLPHHLTSITPLYLKSPDDFPNCLHLAKIFKFEYKPLHSFSYKIDDSVYETVSMKKKILSRISFILNLMIRGRRNHKKDK